MIKLLLTFVFSMISLQSHATIRRLSGSNQVVPNVEFYLRTTGWGNAMQYVKGKTLTDGVMGNAFIRLLQSNDAAFTIVPLSTEQQLIIKKTTDGVFSCMIADDNFPGDDPLLEDSSEKESPSQRFIKGFKPVN